MPTPTYLALRAIQQGETVRAKLDVVANRIAGRANSLMSGQRIGATASVVRSDGIRPKGRAYARVAITGGRDVYRSRAHDDLAAANGYSEFGTATTPRSRVAGRAVSAARGVIG